MDVSDIFDFFLLGEGNGGVPGAGGGVGVFFLKSRGGGEGFQFTSVQNFSLQKKWGPQRKDFGGGYGFLGFDRAFVSTTGLESSL